MAKKNSQNKKNEGIAKDNVFLLKMVLYMILGMQWIRLVNPGQTRQVPLPIGLIIGLLFAKADHFQIDRKIEYAILLIAMMIGLWSQMGIYLSVLK